MTDNKDKTFFEAMETSYVDVKKTEDEGIEVTSFLKATESLITIFDSLSPTAFIPIKSDMNGNVTKIRTKYVKDPKAYESLQRIVLAEAGGKDRVATQGLLWLNRGLRFILEALRRSSEDPSEELSDSFKLAYQQTLKQYHSFLIAPIFTLAMKACPYRENFYGKLAPSKEVLDTEFPRWLGALADCVDTIDALFAEGNYGKGL